MSEKTDVTLTINGTTLKFSVGSEDQERLIDELKTDSKVAPMHNFLTRTVAQESREGLKPFLKMPSAVMQIGEKVVESSTPAIKITVGE